MIEPSRYVNNNGKLYELLTLKPVPPSKYSSVRRGKVAGLANPGKRDI